MVTTLWSSVEFDRVERDIKDHVIKSIKGAKRNIYEIILTEDLDENATLIIYFKDNATEYFILNLLKFFKINEDKELYPTLLTSAILSGHILLEFEKIKPIIDMLYNVYSTECKIRGNDVYLKRC